MKVTAAKPGIGGGIWAGDLSAALPTDASTALSSDFSSLGYVSDDGVTRSLSKESNVVKAWGGNVVAVLDDGKTETFKFKLIEADNLKGLGLTFGEATGDLSSGVTVKSNNAHQEMNAFVISTILSDNVHQRIVIPRGVVTNVGDILYKDNTVIGFELTITAVEDSSGNTAYEYMKTIVTGATGATGETGE